VKLWDVADGRELNRIPGNGRRVYSVAFSPDGRVLAFGLGASVAGDKGQIILWTLDGSRETIRLLGQASFASVAFSPDGKTLASGGGDRVVKLWDVATGRPLANLPGHEGYIASIAFSPDGKTLVTGGQDALVGLFEIGPAALKAVSQRL
jgi:WD40 repeat protein